MYVSIVFVFFNVK